MLMEKKIIYDFKKEEIKRNYVKKKTLIMKEIPQDGKHPKI